MNNCTESVIERAARWVQEGQEVVVATVISTWRSSPRPVGSRMAVAANGCFAGSVSGGCVESAVIQASQEIVSTGQAKLMSFGVTREQAWSVGLPCGGRIEVFLTRLEPEIAEHCERVRAQRGSLHLITELRTGRTHIWPLTPSQMEVWNQGESWFVAVQQAVSRGQSCTVELDEQRWFVQALPAAPRLLIVGAAHLSQALAELARCAEYAVAVIDPRSAFASPERFPGVEVFQDWPDEALARLRPDAQSAVVVLSHDEKLDDPALVAALSSPCFYIGALGSKKTQTARRKRLAAVGFDPEALSRIHGPVGLAIGARSPQEIAIAILAEIIQVQRCGQAPAKVGV